MYITVLIMIATLMCVVLYRSDRSRILRPFDVKTTLPLRGLLAVLIVCHHIGQRPEGYIPWLSKNIFAEIGGPVVAVFFFISGYGLCVSLKKKGAQYLKGFLRKRYSKILPIFVMLTLLCVAISPTPVIRQLSALVNGSTPLPHSWFIYAIIYVYAAFYFSAIYGRSLEKTGALFTGLLVFYVGVSQFILRLPPFWYITILCTAAGYFMAYFEQSAEKFSGIHRGWLTAGVLVLTGVAYVAVSQTQDPGNLFSILWMISIALSVYLIVRVLGMFKWPALVWIGGFSLELYLVHGLFIRHTIGHVHGMNGVALYAVVLLLAIFGGWGIQKGTQFLSSRMK